ncbi:hypothetical protein KKG58_01945 [Patescibacteria group bacterium]|nr:hypothetical protein [Patescibacteria group bacterium]
MKKTGLTLWKAITSVLLVILIASVLTNGFGLKQVLFKVPSEELGNKTIEFINKNLLQPGTTASLGEADCKERSGLCKLTVSIGDNSFDSYISSDGELLFPEAIEMEKVQETNNQAAAGQQANQQASLESIPQQEIPQVRLFAMTFCPFGLQAQKALLPAFELLKDQADIKIHFVNYIMHDKQEIDENLKQYCIQEQQPEKLIPYLNCFVEAGDSEKCLTQVNVNKSSLNTCVSQTDKEYGVSADYEDKESWLSGLYPLFKIDDELNKQYGVGGSPTLVINDQVVSPNRTPEDYKQAICMGFKKMPEECFETLSSKIPAPGFGEGEAGSSTGAKCE